MKGVSSVIAIILLLLITISIVATAAVFFVSNTQESLDSAESSLSAQKERASSVIKIIDSTENTITVKNLGSNPVDIDDINIVGGGDVVDITNSGTIASGQSAILTTEILISGTSYSLVGNFLDVNFVPEYESCEDSNGDGDYLDNGEASFSGTGTSSDPYQIFSPCHLYGVRYNLSAHYELIANIDMTGFDGDPNSNGNWIPIGNNTQRFTGTFDGNDNTINGIVMNLTQDDVGLFGRIENSNISDVGITNVNFSIGSNTVGNNVGALAGVILSSNISNSYSTGNISGGRVAVGGLVGFNNGSIDNSYSSVNIKDRLQSDTGGLVGQNLNSITNSYATGDVNSTANNVGGFVGSSSGSINNSSATGNVNGGTSTGGFVGTNSNTTSSSYATGDVNGTTRAGGFVGSADRANISDSYSTGDVSGNNRTGGFVANAFMSNISKSYSTSNVNGTDDVGGAVGFVNTVNISNLYATGDVNGNSRVGGLIGHARNTNTFTNSYAIGDVDGTNVGGAVGDISGTATTCSAIYWNTQTSGQSTSACGSGQTTSQLQTPTSATGIYSAWLTSIWNFGTSSEYPRLVWE